MSAGFVQSQVDAHAALLEHLPGAGHGWLNALRREALAAFVACGLPTARNEAWKFSSLKALERRALPPLPRSAAAGNEHSFEDAHALAGEIRLKFAADRLLTFVDGRFRADLSTLGALPDGVICASLADTLDDQALGLKFFLARHFRDAAESFARLNTACAADGLVLRIADGVKLPTPIHLLQIGTARLNEAAIHLRHIVELGEGASATLIEHHYAAAAHDGLINTVAQWQLRAAAQLTHVRIQDECAGASSIQRTEVELGAGAQLRTTALEIGSGLARHDFRIALSGRGASLHSRGVFALQGRQHVDTALAVNHAARDTQCDIAWRGVANERARGVFTGAIKVEAGADGSDARLSNKNLLLSANAEIDTRPILEIHADEVKAAHGATVGQLDETALFYLRSRGLPAVEARAMLTFAFCREMFDAVDDAQLRERLTALLMTRLPRREIEA